MTEENKKQKISWWSPNTNKAHIEELTEEIQKQAHAMSTLQTEKELLEASYVELERQYQSLREMWNAAKQNAEQLAEQRASWKIEQQKLEALVQRTAQENKKIQASHQQTEQELERAKHNEVQLRKAHSLLQDELLATREKAKKEQEEFAATKQDLKEQLAEMSQYRQQEQQLRMGLSISLQEMQADYQEEKTKQQQDYNVLLEQRHTDRTHFEEEKEELLKQKQDIEKLLEEEKEKRLQQEKMALSLIEEEKEERLKQEKAASKSIEEEKEKRLAQHQRLTRFFWTSWTSAITALVRSCRDGAIIALEDAFQSLKQEWTTNGEDFPQTLEEWLLHLQDTSLFGAITHDVQNDTHTFHIEDNTAPPIPDALKTLQPDHRLLSPLPFLLATLVETENTGTFRITQPTEHADSAGQINHIELTKRS
jgi:hypothetical protein